ncbi:hypothetical protein [Aquabacterium sp. A08]|uniref:hypothetical protein n=1 Tax=Aquabacterium sp. A08 TaxID=2718532 RepID=UPI00141E70F5|nr:hypothetical protein [Aquabacterium sp. A08]NIC43321.1 hypothetical protein [Aquabacterium sp. A08]
MTPQQKQAEALRALVRAAQDYMTASIEELASNEESANALNLALNFGGVAFVEVAQNMPPMNDFPIVRIGVHDPARGSRYLIEQRLQTMRDWQ